LNRLRFNPRLSIHFGDMERRTCFFIISAMEKLTRGVSNPMAREDHNLRLPRKANERIICLLR